ncbi:MAG: hypothetical protein H6980_00990 [Gammaproteobacteria bacterium]|nr:hypothetical protein [Gammaproteobacteria bacterium]
MIKIPGTEVFRAHDAEGDIVVYDSTEIRILAFDSPVEQSALAKSRPWRLHYPYTQAMMLGALFTPRLRRAAVLGLGGGSLVRALRHGWPTLHITAVERRAAVATVARDWFMIEPDPHLDIDIDDAQGWLERDPPGQDLIFADLYDHTGMDAVQIETRFLARCAACLADGGVLVANMWTSTSEAARQHREAMEAVFGERVLRVSVQGGNNVVLAFRDPLPKPRPKDFMQAAQRLGLTLDIPLQRHARRLWVENTRRLQSG